MSSRSSVRRSVRGEYIETHCNSIKENPRRIQGESKEDRLTSQKDTGNKVSRRSKIEGTPHIILAGRVVIQADVCLRGDLCRLPSDADAKDNARNSIQIGRYTMVSTGATIHPPHRVFRGGDLLYYPIKIGEHVFIGANCFINAAAIGSHVHVGPSSIIENGCIIKDYVKILPNTLVPAGMVIPSGVVVAGSPASIIADLPDGWGQGPVSVHSGEWIEGGELKELVKSIK